MPSVGAVSKISGLYTSPNALSFVPEGALKQALNTVINFPGVLESRRGFEYVPYSFGTLSSRANQLLSYLGTVLVQYDTSKLAHDTGIAFSDYSGTYGPPSGATRVRGAEANQNLYFTSVDGVKVIDQSFGEPVPVGLPRAPTPVGQLPSGGFLMQGSFSGNPGAGWMPGDSQAAYIALVGTRDASNNIKLGEASNPYYVVNPPDISFLAGDAAAITSGFVALKVGSGNARYYQDGDVVSVTLSPTDANYPNGFKTVQTPLTFDKIELAWTNSAAHNVQPGVISGANRNTFVTFQTTPEMTTSQFVRIYRTKSSPGATVPPNQDFFLVNEIPITSGILSAGSYQFVDSTPDELLLNPYYNNVNVGGETPDGSPDNENGRAPFCRDLVVWDDRLWGASLIEKHVLNVNLLGTESILIYDSAGGLRSGDTVTVGGVTFTAVHSLSAPLAANQFCVFDLAVQTDMTASECVARTAQSLATQVTSNPSCTVNAYCTNFNIYDATTLPGAIKFVNRDPVGSAFTFATSRPSAWNPDPTSTLTSTADNATNELWFSKQEQSEAVPAFNRLSIGPRNSTILRIRPILSQLFVFTDRGVYTVSNTYPYRVDLLSKTAILVAPDSLVDLDDGLFCLSTQGVVKVSAAGVGVTSMPIEADIKRLYGTGITNLTKLAQAVGYESYRKYILTMPTVPGDTANTQQFVYDVATRAWTQWDVPAASMLLVPDTDTLYIAKTDENRVSIERKNYDATDYSDESFAVTLSSVSGMVLSLTSVAGINPGDMIYQSSVTRSLVVSVDPIGNTVTVADTLDGWVPGMGTACYRGIHNAVQFSGHFAGLANHIKHWQAITFHFKTPGLATAQAVFFSELGPNLEMVSLALQGWGAQPWGRFAWAQLPGPKNSRVFLTPNATRAAYLTVGLDIREARGVWSLLGYTPEVRDVSARSTVT